MSCMSCPKFRVIISYYKKGSVSQRVLFLSLLINNNIYIINCFTTKSMGRIANPNPTIKRSIQVSDPSWQFILKYKNGPEPIYLAVDRLIHYYSQGKEQLCQESEQKTRAIEKLQTELLDTHKKLDQYKKMGSLFNDIKI